MSLACADFPVVFHNFSGNPRAAELAGALETLGATTIWSDQVEVEMSTDTPRVVFFDSTSATLSNQLVELSMNGLLRVVAVCATATPPSAREAFLLLRAGAADVLAGNDMAELAKQILARFNRWIETDELLRLPVIQRNLAGLSGKWIHLLREVVESARFTSSDILLMGDSGTGKELLARLIHTLDPRSQRGDLVVLDCTTIVPDLSGSEFFGHERGAFTGAASGRDGAFALANGGTLFLDEIGDLQRTLQSQLLRVIQERSFKRVGGNHWQKTEFRLVCATNKNLQGEVDRGSFRADLYYRLAGRTFQLPSLCERPEDIPVLARFFLQQLVTEGDAPSFDRSVQDYLRERDYPGNVRELKQVVARMLHRHVGSGPISIGDVQEEDRTEDSSASTCADSCVGLEHFVRQAMAKDLGLKEIGRLAESIAVHIAVQEEDGNLQRAARRLRVSDRALQMRRATGGFFGSPPAAESEG